jgi:hypothetical protein
MAVPRRVGGVFVLLLSFVGIIGCVAGIIAIWVFSQRLPERAQRVTDRLESGLERVSVAGQNIQSAMARARTDMANIDKESANLSERGEKNRRASRAIRTILQQNARPDLDDLTGRLATLSDAAVAVTSLMQSFQEISPGRVSPIDPGDLNRRADDVQQISSTLRRLEAAVGDGEKDTSQRDVEGATSDVDSVLQRCQAGLENWQSDLTSIRADVARVREQAPRWMIYVAVAVTVLCLWMGAGQLSLFGRALRWCQGA